MILQLNPALELLTPKGLGICHFLIDYGQECDLIWVCILHQTGEIWCYKNYQVKMPKNITLGRMADEKKK